LNHRWYEPLGDGTGAYRHDLVAVALAGEVLAFTPKRVGPALSRSRCPLSGC
jgi:hypothetical protein